MAIELNDGGYLLDVMARDDLVGLSEIAERYGVARHSAWRWSRRPDFPEPLARLTAGFVWALGDVEAWAAKTLPLPGTTDAKRPKR